MEDFQFFNSNFKIPLLNCIELQKDKIKTTNYVGKLQLVNTTIEIKPKFSFDDLLLASVDCYGEHFLEYVKTFSCSKITIEVKEGFHRIKFIKEAIAKKFASNLFAMMPRGLVKEARTCVDQSRYFYGNVNFVKSMLSTFPRNNYFYIENFLFSLDNLENRLLKLSLHEAISILNTNESNRFLLNDLELIYFELEDIPLFLQLSWHELLDLFDQIHFDEQNNHYKEVLFWGKILLRHKYTLLLEQTNYTVKMDSFLIDMNTFFEDYVRKIMQEVLCIKGYCVTKPKIPIAKNTIGNDAAFIEPDILITKPDNIVVAVCDVKYKKKLSKTDDYQMYTYIMETNSPLGIILRAVNTDMKAKRLILRNGAILKVELITVNSLQIFKESVTKICNDILQFQKTISN